MPIDFSTEYSERSDDELLQLASARHSLTTEAAAALDAELRRRNLTESDRLEHQRFVKRQEQREARKHRRKTFGTFKYQLSWLDLLWAFAGIALISFVYLTLPGRYRMKSDWEDTAFIVMMTSVLIAIASRSLFWRKSAFWASLVISSATHLVLVHAWRERVPNLSRGQGKLATWLCAVLCRLWIGLAIASEFLRRRSRRQPLKLRAQVAQVRTRPSADNAASDRGSC